MVCWGNDISLQISQRLSSRNLTWFILEYFVPYSTLIFITLYFIAKFLYFKGVFIACKKSFYSFNVFLKRWLSFKTKFKIKFLLRGTSSWKVLGIIPAYVHKFSHGFNFASKVLLVLLWKFHLKQFSDTSQKLQNFEILSTQKFDHDVLHIWQMNLLYEWE